MSITRPMLISTALLGIATGGCRPAREPVSSREAAPPVPMHQEPRHHLVFQNPLVRVVEVMVPPGDTTGYHVHANRSVGVRIKGARTWEQFLGASPDSVANPGFVPALFDNWSASLPYTHRVGNADSVPFYIVIGERLASSGLTCQPLPDSPTRHLVKEGPTAVTYELRLPPHSEDSLHVHLCPGLTVLGTAGAVSEQGTAPVAVGGKGAGWWSWRDPGHRHLLRNNGDGTLTVFEIDWR